MSLLRSVLLGTPETGARSMSVLALAGGGFLVTFVAYVLGLFAVSGGVVWVPLQAAAVGMLAGGWVGYVHRGMAFAWLVTYTALLGYHASHAVAQVSGLLARVTYVVRPDGLAFFAVEAMVGGTLAFAVGRLVRLGVDTVSSDGAEASAQRK